MDQQQMVSSSKKKALVAVMVLVLAFGAYAGYRTYLGYQRVAEMQSDKLPEFSEPEAGLRAPISDGFAQRIGFSKFQDILATAKAWGLTCRDTSIRAIMGTKREEAKKELQAAKERGEDIDGITGASLIDYKSQKERNPQIRYSCTGVKPAQLKDRTRTEGATGRVLFVFDSLALPLRHASFRRTHTNHPQARDDAAQTVEFYKGVYGPPHKEVPLPVEVDGRVKFTKYLNHRFIWRWPDLVVTVTAMNMGARGVNILESVEVPWPVRSTSPSDSPQRISVEGASKAALTAKKIQEK